MIEFTFDNPAYLWTLLIIPFVIITHFFTLKKAKTAALKFSNYNAIERVSKGEFLGKPYKGFFKNKNLSLLILRLIVYTLLIFSVTGTTVWYLGTVSDYDFVLAIDSSSSMLADDFDPNRLEAAKDAAKQFISIVPDRSNIGVTTFASSAFIDLELISDKGELKVVISNIGIKESGGTNIGDAIITSSNLMTSEKGDKKSRAIILITDGQSNVGTPVDVAIDYAKSKNTVIHTIGIGTEEGGKLMGVNFTSKLDEESLNVISSSTDGKYFRAESKEFLIEAFNEIASFSEKKIPFNISWILLIIALVLLAFEWVLLYTVYKTIP